MKIKVALLCFLLSVKSVYAEDANLDLMSIIDLYKEVEAINYDYEELQKAYEDAKNKEQSLANRTLTALTVAATGIGGMELAQGLAEQNADSATERDMAAYMATFQCKIGDKGNKINGGNIGITAPGANQLINLYQKYVDLAADLRERKAALGIRPGIESDVVLDKAATGLYDDTSSGVNNGTYASLYRAARGNQSDIDKLAEQSDASGRRVSIGGAVTGAGAIGGAVGNILINGGDGKSSSGDGLKPDSNTLKQATGLFLGK